MIRGQVKEGGGAEEKDIANATISAKWHLHHVRVCALPTKLATRGKGWGAKFISELYHNELTKGTEIKTLRINKLLPSCHVKRSFL